MPFFFSALFNDVKDPVADARPCDQLPGAARLRVKDVDTEPGEYANDCFGTVEEERVCEEDTSSMREESCDARF